MAGLLDGKSYDIAKLSKIMCCPGCGCHSFDFTIRTYVAAENGALRNIDLQRMLVEKDNFAYCRKCGWESVVSDYIPETANADEIFDAQFVAIEPEVLEVDGNKLRHIGPADDWEKPAESEPGVAELLSWLFKRCKAEIQVSVNPQRGSYQTVAQYLSDDPTYAEELPVELFDELSKGDTLVIVWAYPDTPGGHFRVIAADLLSALRNTKKAIEEEDNCGC